MGKDKRRGKQNSQSQELLSLHLGLVEELSDKAVEILVKAHKKLDRAKSQDLSAQS